MDKWPLGVPDGWGWSSRPGRHSRPEGQKGLLQLDTGHGGKITVFQDQADLGLSPEPIAFQILSFWSSGCACGGRQRTLVTALVSELKVTVVCGWLCEGTCRRGSAGHFHGPFTDSFD